MLCSILDVGLLLAWVRVDDTIGADLHVKDTLDLILHTSDQTYSIFLNYIHIKLRQITIPMHSSRSFSWINDYLSVDSGGCCINI